MRLRSRLTYSRGRDFTGVRWSSDEGEGGRGGGREDASDAGQDSLHTIHSGEHASFAGNRIRGSRKTVR